VKRQSDLRGWAAALAAAVGFGIATPLVQRASAGAGPFASAALLYAGSGGLLALALVVAAPRPAPLLPRAAWPLLGAIAVLGAVVAPAALVFGLARTSAHVASLLLNAEGAFTVLLAGWWNRERLGARVLAGVGCVFGGAALVAVPGHGGPTQIVGAAAVGLATLGWAADSTLAARLSGHDPRPVVAGKGLTGAALAAAIAFVRSDAWPVPAQAVRLVAIGAIGYGSSLALYLIAQRRLGAARAAAAFAAGPFVGALAAFALGDRVASPWLGPGALLLVVGVALPLSERHRHRHRHAALVHEHVHDHDDPHHQHPHDPPVSGPHSHRHEHDELEHDHEHAEDEHHRHH